MLECLAGFDDEEILEAIDTFERDAYISGLDASGIYVVLSNMKERISGVQTTRFDLKEVE